MITIILTINSIMPSTHSFYIIITNVLASSLPCKNS